MDIVLVSREMAEENSLRHYRTRGSKNGIRRYQYPDGSLTPEGREHYGVGAPREKNKAEDAGADTRPKGTTDTQPKNKFDRAVAKIEEHIEKRHAQNAPLTRKESRESDKEVAKKVTGGIAKINAKVQEQRQKAADKQAQIKAIRNMSDEELNKNLARLRREKELSELMAERETREKSPLRQATERLFHQAAEELTRKSLTWAVDTMLNKAKAKVEGKNFKLSDYKNVDIYSMDAEKVSAISKAFNDAANLSRNRWAIEHPNGNDNGGGGNNGSGNKNNTGNQSGQQNQNNGGISKNQRKRMRSMAGSGKSAAEIAREMGVSESTVRQYAGEQLKKESQQEAQRSEQQAPPRSEQPGSGRFNSSNGSEFRRDQRIFGKVSRDEQRQAERARQEALNRDRKIRDTTLNTREPSVSSVQRGIRKGQRGIDASYRIGRQMDDEALRRQKVGSVDTEHELVDRWLNNGKTGWESVREEARRLDEENRKKRRRSR